MPTARSWTDPVADLGHLLRFRAATVRRPRTAAAAALLLVALTLAAALGPALLDGAGSATGRAGWVRAALPGLLAGTLTLTLGAAVAAGGGRELLDRDQLAIHPVGAATEHLGALVLAPLSLAWLLQTWLLLGATALALGPGAALPGQALVLVWVCLATALGQLLAWSVELLRRLPHGVVATRALAGAVAAGGVLLHLTGRLDDLVARSPLALVAAEGLAGGPSPRWVATGVLLAGLGVLAVAAGVVPARAALRRTPRAELRVEGGAHPARRSPRSDVAMLVRVDRASIWRTVAMRRGLTVLAIGPAVVAVVGRFDWAQATVLPGLVASGGALLFGVNAWCLDGRGVLWRESLPVDPAAVFWARSRVLGEWLAAAAAATLLLTALRAGLPDAAEATALASMWVVVVVQVVAVAMSWSGRRPFAVDLRSARATPAPPSVMVGYSARLALSTTLTSLVFSAAAGSGVWWLGPVLAVPFVSWSVARWRRARRRWVAPPERARVTMTVAG